MYIKTEAIVLRKVFYNDSDAILTLFSRKLGKISVYARGVRKPRTMISSVAHPFIYGEFVLRGKPDIYNISSAEIINSNYAIREDLKKLSYASYFLELCRHSIHEGMINNRLFNLTVEILKKMDGELSDIDKIKLAYEIKLLNYSGLKPEVSKCLKCGINEIEHLTVFSIADGGVVCENCSNKERISNGVPIKKQFIHLIRYLIEKDIDLICKTKINDGMIKHLDKIFELYIKYHMDIQSFKSLEFLKTIQ
jgi:DNA repair protein RecO (recombination protein O)